MSPSPAWEGSLSRDRVFRSLLLLFLLVLTAFYVRDAITNVHHQDGWSMGDWLINYHGGFIRRGLPGAVLLALCRLLHLNIFWTLAVFQLGIFIALEIALWRLVRRSQWHTWMLFALASPATLLFSVREFPEAYRKEDILFLGMALLLLNFRRGSVSRWLTVWLSVFAAVCMLSHEGLVCYMPYLFAALYAGLRSVRRTLVVAALPVVTTLVCFGLAAAHPGNAHMAQAVCEGIGYRQLQPVPSACSGAIAYLAFDKQHARDMVSALAQQRHYEQIYPVVALLASLPLLAGGISLWNISSERRSLLALIAAFGLAVVGSIPLFVYAFDWNRWIYIHSFCILLILLFLNDRHPEAAPLPMLRRSGVLALAVAVLLYASVWRDSYRQLGRGSHFKKRGEQLLRKL